MGIGSGSLEEARVRTSRDHLGATFSSGGHSHTGLAETHRTGARYPHKQIEEAPHWRRSTAFTTRSRRRGCLPILKDGTWPFLPGDEVQVNDGVVAHTAPR
jgi:hypothetical protein